MKLAIALTGLAILMTGPALAATTCSTAPASQFKSKASLTKMLKTEGMTVRQIKTEKGCYEVYALDKHGKKVNVAYNAKTLKKLANAEAGEK